jgi:hypothetical protein
MDTFRLLNQDNLFDIFTVSETWLTSSITNSEISLPGYTLVRNDRSNKRGGGTAIFVRDGIPYKHRTDLSDEFVETCWVEVNRAKCKNQFICCAYRAPDFCCDSFINNLKTPLQSYLLNQKLPCLAISMLIFFSKRRESAYNLKQKLQRFARLNDLEQLINTPQGFVVNQEQPLIWCL